MCGLVGYTDLRDELRRRGHTAPGLVSPRTMFKGIESLKSGHYSGGLDSSLIAATINRVSPAESRHSFSIAFSDRAMSESKHQRAMARHVNSIHHEIMFD